MIAKYIFDKFIETHYPQINNAACIHLRNHKGECQKCTKNCPNEALSFVKKNFRVNRDLCKPCGLCKTKCPAQAISIKDFGETRTLKKLNEQETIIIGCEREGNQGDINFPCLNSLHREFLVIIFLAAGNSQVYINTSHCKDCDWEGGCGDFSTSFKQAQDFIEVFPIKKKIKVIDQIENMPVKSEKIYTRRELFTFLKDKTYASTLETTSDFLMDEKDKFYSQRPHLLAYINRYISEIPSEVKKNKIISNFFGSWNIHNSCNGCGLCQAVCPNKAWKLTKDDSGISLTHHAGKCNGCRMCADLCPKKSLVEKKVYLFDIEEGFQQRFFLNVE